MIHKIYYIYQKPYGVSTNLKLLSSMIMRHYYRINDYLWILYSFLIVHESNAAKQYSVNHTCRLYSLCLNEETVLQI